MMEINNRRNIRIAADVTNTLTVSKDVIKRLKSYVGGTEPADKRNVTMQDALRMDDQDKKDEWAPCRFSVHGWKY